MLPEKLSTDLTSFNYQKDRVAIVIEMVISREGTLKGSEIFRAVVRNKAKLAYNSVAAWLEGIGPLPEDRGALQGLDENLRLQDLAAQKMKAFRHEHGALSLETIQTRALFDVMRSGTLRSTSATGQKRSLRTSWSRQME